jgi:hypothetical protein
MVRLERTASRGEVLATIGKAVSRETSLAVTTGVEYVFFTCAPGDRKKEVGLVRSA